MNSLKKISLSLSVLIVRFRVSCTISEKIRSHVHLCATRVTFTYIFSFRKAGLFVHVPGNEKKRT